MTRREADSTTLSPDQLRMPPVSDEVREATHAAARRTVAQLALRNDHRVVNDELRAGLREVLEMLGLLPGVPDPPAQRRGRPIPTGLPDPPARRNR